MQFDFYATRLVQYHGLVKDTAILNAQIRSNTVKNAANQAIISQFSKIHANDSMAFNNQGKITAACQSDFNNLSKNYIKETKKNKCVKSVLLSTIILAILEAIVIVIKY